MRKFKTIWELWHYVINNNLEVIGREKNVVHLKDGEQVYLFNTNYE